LALAPFCASWQGELQNATKTFYKNKSTKIQCHFPLDVFLGLSCFGALLGKESSKAPSKISSYKEVCTTGSDKKSNASFPLILFLGVSQRGELESTTKNIGKQFWGLPLFFGL
jgi:hypothetical protein